MAESGSSDFPQIVVLVCVAFGLAQPVDAQGVEATLVATVGGDLSAEALLLEESSPALSVEHGKILVAPVGSGVQYALFDLNGQLLGVRGEPGQGPGEFRGVHAVRDGTEGFIVMGRPSVQVDRENGDILRRLTPLDVANDLAVVGGDSALVSITSYGGERVRMLDLSTGSILGRYFPLPPAGEQEPYARFAVLSEPVSDDFLAASLGSCRVHRIALNRTAEPVEPVEAGSWCERLDGEQAVSSGGRPAPKISDLRFFGDGTIWIVGRVPDRDWTPDASSLDDRYDTLVEVIRSDGSRAIHRMPGSFRRGLRGPHVATATQDEVGVISLHIWKLTVTE